MKVFEFFWSWRLRTLYHVTVLLGFSRIGLYSYFVLAFIRVKIRLKTRLIDQNKIEDKIENRIVIEPLLRGNNETSLRGRPSILWGA